MQRYFIQLSYNGASYHGWQVQPNAITVQEVIANALSILTREKVDVVGAGRTDTGVHASFFVAHFELENALVDPEQLAHKLNAFLPEELFIVKIFAVDPDMHARFSAVSRTYHYYVSEQKDPFRKGFVNRINHTLDMDQMNKAAALLLTFDDFTSFSKLHTDVNNNLCKVSKAVWRRESGLLVFEITANRFLRNMVRAIVGTLIDVGRGKLTLDDFVAVVEAKDRCEAGTSVFAGALFLTDIQYPEPVNSLFIRNPSFEIGQLANR